MGDSFVDLHWSRQPRPHQSYDSDLLILGEGKGREGSRDGLEMCSLPGST
jgi:hypothetical protein